MKTQKLKLANPLIPKVLSGEKRHTVRKGRRNIKLGKLVFAPQIRSKNFKSVTVNVVEIRYKRLSDIIQADIPDTDCGIDKLDTWRKTMLEYYPDLKKNDEMTIVYFTHK